jgi:hypothetical protein
VPGRRWRCVPVHAAADSVARAGEATLRQR